MKLDKMVSILVTQERFKEICELRTRNGNIRSISEVVREMVDYYFDNISLPTATPPEEIPKTIKDAKPDSEPRRSLWDDLKI